MMYIGFESEVWKDIIIDNSYTGYQVSTYGNIRLKKTKEKINTWENIYSALKRPYLMVRLNWVDPNTKKKYTKICSVSRLVAINFIPIPRKYKKDGLSYDDLEVDHLRDGDDDNHRDNSIYNLQWITRKENVQKAKEAGLYNKDYLKGIKRLGTGMRGSDNHESHYNEQIIRDICEDLVENKLIIKDIAKKNNVPRTLVEDVKKGRAWPHVSCEYDFSGYDMIEGSVYNYHKKDLKLLEDLILADASNDVIRNVLKWDTNKTTATLISKYRKKLGKTLQKPRRTFSKEYIEKIDSLIKEGKTTSEISKIMGESDPSRLYCLISKRKKIIKQNETISSQDS